MSRRRRLALAGVALILIVGPALAVDEVLWRGAHAEAFASAVGDAILDPGSIFAARSPGARGGGMLLQTKPERLAQNTYVPPGGLFGAPIERVLAGVRERPPEPDFVGPPPAAPLVQTLPEFAMGGRPPPGGFPAAPASIGGPGFIPLANPPGGGGPPGGGKPPGDTPPSDTPPGGGPPPSDSPPGGPPISAVPEPAAWMLTIMAVFGLGAALRRKRSRRHQAAGLNA